MDYLDEHPELVDRIERFAAVHLDPDQEVQARFLELVADLVEAGREVESRLSSTADPSNPFYRQSRALQEACVVLSDIADGEPETTDAATNLKWAEDQSSDVLRLISSLNKHHWPTFIDPVPSDKAR
jgi:hypothetical protein